MTHRVINGAFKPEETGEERQVVGERAILTVDPGLTACYVRTGIKWPSSGRKVVLFVGEIDGVKAYVTERDSMTHVFLTRGEIVP